MTLRYLFMDMNSYFASVEQQDRPELRGWPVAVVPMMTDSTCCIAASYEAKRFGVRTGTGVAEAKKLCPDIRLIQARPRRYVWYHHRVIEAVESCLHVDAVCSIDEMYGRLMGSECQPEHAVRIANHVKTALWSKVGQCLRCSIGLAPNIWLSKVASGMQKPDGMSTILAEDLPGRLHTLELPDLTGIGRQMHQRLLAHGVRSVAQLCALSEPQLSTIWGSRVHGRLWWEQLRGHDIPVQPTRRRTVGHSHVLPPAQRSGAGARAVLVRMIHKAAARMRRLGYWARMMTVSVRFMDRSKWEQKISLGTCRDTLTMLRAFAARWPRSPVGTPLKVAVVLTGLVADHAVVEPLFAQERRLDDLARTMDRLDEKYGTHTVYFASMFGARDSAPTRISFTQIPSMKEF